MSETTDEVTAVADDIMPLASCENEQAVLEAVRSGRWDPRLKAHIAECPVCAEVDLVASLLRQESESAPAGALLPKAGQIWWKAQVRSRQEAAKRAVRPIVIAQRLGFGSAILAFCSMVAWRWWQVQQWLERLGAHWTNIFGFDHRAGLWTLGLAISAAAFLLLIGVAGYVAHAED